MQRIFKKAIKGLLPKIGPILIQLPPNFIYNEEKIAPFFKILRQEYAQFRFAIEARNETWMNDKTLHFLTSYQLIWVIGDAGKQLPSRIAETTNELYFRFHGQENLYRSKYSYEHLKLYVEKTVQALNQDKTVWAFFNNDYRGFAVNDARQFIRMIYHH
jgi:uncharacterized protein YecE (DUF72 family)